MIEKVLGKIDKVWFGLDEGRFGLTLTLSLRGGGTGVSTFKGGWDTWTPSCKYSYEDWLKVHTETALFILDLLKKSKKRNITDLAGVPVEAEIEGNVLKDWRVLEEVL